MKEDLLKIVEHYGVLKQLKYFQSEVFELNEAIIESKIKLHLLEGNPPKMVEPVVEELIQHITEEIADVLVMLGQFMQYYNIDKDKIETIMEYKIERQLRRIEDERKSE